MSLENSITVIGNLTRDPELRYTTGGTAVASFSVAHTPRRRNAAGEWEDGDTSFFNCSAWRELGEHVAASLVKGNRVIVVGTMQQRDWEDKEGNKRTSYELQVDAVGPELKWANITYEKASRSGGGGGGGGGNGAPRHAPDPVYGDEEPF